MSLTLLSACYTHDDGGNAVVETWRAASLLPLSAIDSLMWRQPDSALLALQAFAATPEADSLDAFNGHYCQLLISELLYKNDYPQTNRPDLQQAVSYFDSLSFTLNDHPHAPRRHCGLDPQSPTRNDQIVFLDARAHYINGVGYYERDSLVEACKEYLKALEVMEKHFEEKLTEIYNTFRQDELERMHQKAIAKNKKIVLFIVVGLFVALLAVIVIHLMRKKRFDKQLQMERQLHEMNRKALGGKLKKSNESLRLQKEETKNLLQSLENLQQKENWDTLDYFLKEDICTEIAVLLKGKQIKREAKSDAYPELHLDDTQLSRLNVAVERHFAGFGKTLTDLYPRISRNAMNQCLLYLLNLEDVQIAALLACDYSTVKRRSANLKKMFGTEKEPRQFIRDLVL